jgi:hypothetical protein
MSRLTPRCTRRPLKRSRAAAGERETLRRVDPRLLIQEARDVALIGAEAEQRLEKKVGAHRSMGGFHLRDTRLTGAESLGHLCLGHAQLFSPAAQSLSEGELRIHKPAFIVGQAQEIACVTDGPPRSLQTSTLICLHGLSLSRCVSLRNSANRLRQSSSTLPGVDSVFFRNTSRTTTASIAM